MAAAADAQRSMISDIAGTAVPDALMRLIDSESTLPGRKIILYLYDSLVLPPNRQEMIRRVIRAANQGKISFYCVDVRGLATGSFSGAGLSGLTTSMGQSTRDNTSILSSAQMVAFESMADVAVSRLKMVELAESTGGLAIFNTNQFQKYMAMVVADVRTHYELTYVPDSAVYDGPFRKVEVTVRHPELRVQSRDGYFALPQGAGPAVRAVETDGLRAGDRPARLSVPSRCNAFSAHQCPVRVPDGLRCGYAAVRSPSGRGHRCRPGARHVRGSGEEPCGRGGR